MIRCFFGRITDAKRKRENLITCTVTIFIIQYYIALELILGEEEARSLEAVKV